MSRPTGVQQHSIEQRYRLSFRDGVRAVTVFAAGEVVPSEGIGREKSVGPHVPVGRKAETARVVQDGDPLAHTTQFAWLTLFGVGTLQGSVDLQGRSDEGGGTVTVLNASGYLASTTVAADGSWSFASIPAGSYQVNIEMERYLDAQKGEFGGGVSVLAGNTTTLSAVKLLGGDANNDDVIDISDAVIIGSMFGKSGGDITDPGADINNSGNVDVLDLVLLGGNLRNVIDIFRIRFGG